MNYPVHVLVDRNKVYRQIIEELKYIQLVRKSEKPCLTFDSEKRLYTWSPSILGRDVSTGISSIVRRIMLDAVEKGERLGPGSGELVLAWASTLAEEILSSLIGNYGDTDWEKIIQNESEGFLRKGQLVARLLDENNLWMVIKQLSGNPKAASMAKDALELAGLEGRIFVDSQTSDKSYIEVIHGYSFQLSPQAEVLQRGEKWDKKHVKVSTIDGFVEKVSEIDKILTMASKDREPVVIFSRGFSEEVIATLGVNRIRETLDIIPIVVPFDEKCANTLKDISVVAGANLVSSLKGELISSIHFDDLPYVDSVTIEGGHILIHNEKTRNNVSLLVSELQNRRRKSESELLNAFLDDRIRSLSAHSVKIACEHNEAEMLPIFDLIFRTSRAIVSYGVLDLYSWDPPQIFESSMRELISTSKIPCQTPVLTGIAAVKLGTQAALELISINATLTIDRG